VWRDVSEEHGRRAPLGGTRVGHFVFSFHLHLVRLIFRALVARLRGGPGRQRTRASAQDCSDHSARLPPRGSHRLREVYSHFRTRVRYLPGAGSSSDSKAPPWLSSSRSQAPLLLPSRHRTSPAAAVPSLLVKLVSSHGRVRTPAAVVRQGIPSRVSLVRSHHPPPLMFHLADNLLLDCSAPPAVSVYDPTPALGLEFGYATF
jgi:hypothetical protein